MNSTLSEQVEIITHKVEQTKVSATSLFFECSGPVTRRVSWQNILFKNQESRVFVHCSQTLYSVTSQCSIQTCFITIWMVWVPKKCSQKGFRHKFSMHILCKNRMKWSANTHEAKISSRDKYSSPATENTRYFQTLSFNHWVA